MKTSDLFFKGRVVYSCEVFPPKPETPIEDTLDTLKKISRLKPDFVSVTYGAGGAGATRTGEVASIVNGLGMTAAAHLTCAGNTEDSIKKELADLKDKKVENILVLRGDAAKNNSDSPFKYASDLAAFIKKREPSFNLLGACYPEGHPEAKSLKSDVDNLKIKIDSGVSHLISQLFFNNDDFFRFLDIVRRKKIPTPISAGIMPVLSAASIKRIVSMCGASLPITLSRICARYDGADLEKAGLDYAANQIRTLVDGGAEGIHLYTMNRPHTAEYIFNKAL